MNAMPKLVLATSLALAALASTPSDVLACGGYGAVSEEDRARSAVVRALHDAKVDFARVGPVDVTLRSATRGIADVTVDDDHRLRLRLIKRQGRWTVRRFQKA